jgi:putative spermidine/putrescine transport system substrate-binding protein
MGDLDTTRRALLGGIGAAAALSSGALAQPATPLVINIVDVAGNLALTQPAFDAYRREFSKNVSRFVFSKAPAPELPAKLRAQQEANRVDIDLVMTGTDGLSAGMAQNSWEPLFPNQAGKLPDLDKILQPPAKRLQTLAQNQGCILAWYPSGPLLEYMPDKVKQPPQSADELMAWCRANPKRFLYARPANSGPGRTFIMGLPYLLGDSDPHDPVNGWAKTWAFLAALGEFIEYYPSGTAATMKELGEGSRDMIISTTGWDINPRVLGVVPKEAEIAVLRGFHWISDAQFAAIPKGLPPERLAVVLDVVSHLLTKESQAVTFDRGYLYPGPCVAGVTIDMAPQQSQDDIREFGRPMYDKLIADVPIELPLDADKLVYAFRRWDEQVGVKTAK